MKTFIMLDVKQRQIKNLFLHTGFAMRDGLWFSGIQGEGEFMLWWSNGTLRMYYFYKDGMEHGEFKEWNRRGELRQHGIYKEGEIVKDYLSGF